MGLFLESDVLGPAEYVSGSAWMADGEVTLTGQRRTRSWKLCLSQTPM